MTYTLNTLITENKPKSGYLTLVFKGKVEPIPDAIDIDGTEFKVYSGGYNASTRETHVYASMEAK